MDISYRQGMHELLAPILWVVEQDAIDPSSSNIKDMTGSSSMVGQIFDAKFIAHDSFTLFSTVMRHAKESYQPSDGRIAPSRSGISAREQSAIAPRSQHIMDSMLVNYDPDLAAHLKSIDIVPQVFLMRWIRLLFGREFSFEQTLEVWDRIFAEDPSGNCVDFICVAMLLRTRWQLLECDNSEALRLLLHYPEPSASDPPPTFVDDALYLMNNRHSEAGYHVIEERTGRQPPKPKTPPPSSTPQRPLSNFVTPARFREQSSGLESLFHSAAREVYSRGEKLGVNQAVRDAVQEVRKNVQGHSRTDSVNPTKQDSGQVASNDHGALLQQIDALKERNKSLAKMLETAVSELWTQQKGSGMEKTAAKQDIDAFTLAIGKVQFVQVYLEDASLDLPAESSPPAQAMELSIETATDAPKDKAITEQTDSTPSIAAEQGTTAQDPAPPTSNPSKDHNEDNKSLVTGDSLPPTHSASPAKKTIRPRINEPSFSWILGQDEKPGENSTSARSTFLRSTSPFTMPEQQSPANRRSNARSSAAYLFGDDDEDTAKAVPTPAKVRRPSRSKEKKKGADVDDEEVFVLGTLKSK